MVPSRKCRDCEGLAYGRNRLCDSCRALCKQCRKAPHTKSGNYCHACGSTRQRDNWRRLRSRSHERVLRDRLRSRVNHAFYRGEIERGPCIKCGTHEALQIHITDAFAGTYVWMCAPHRWETVADANRQATAATKAAQEEESRRHAATRFYAPDRLRQAPQAERPRGKKEPAPN
jgi:hypothetical protein